MPGSGGGGGEVCRSTQAMLFMENTHRRRSKDSRMMSLISVFDILLALSIIATVSCISGLLFVLVWTPYWPALIPHDTPQGKPGKSGSKGASGPRGDMGLPGQEGAPGQRGRTEPTEPCMPDSWHPLFLSHSSFLVTIKMKLPIGLKNDLIKSYGNFMTI